MLYYFVRGVVGLNGSIARVHAAECAVVAELFFSGLDGAAADAALLVGAGRPLLPTGPLVGRPWTVAVTRASSWIER